MLFSFIFVNIINLSSTVLLSSLRARKENQTHLTGSDAEFILDNNIDEASPAPLRSQKHSISSKQIEIVFLQNTSPHPSMAETSDPFLALSWDFEHIKPTTPTFRKFKNRLERGLGQIYDKANIRLKNFWRSTTLPVLMLELADGYYVTTSTFDYLALVGRNVDEALENLGHSPFRFVEMNKYPYSKKQKSLAAGKEQK